VFLFGTPFGFNEVARDYNLIKEDGCAWGDLVSFDPSLQGNIVVDQAMLAMWSSVLVFLAKKVSQEEAFIGDLRLPDNFVVDNDLSNEEFISSITMCALLLRSGAKSEDGSLVCDKEGVGLKWGEPCSIEVSLAQLTLIETSLVYVLDHALSPFRSWVALDNDNEFSDASEELSKLKEVLIWCREDVLGVANLLCKEEGILLH